MKCSDLREEVTRPRWLTIPNSRLVVNPWDVTQPARYPMPAVMAGSLPVNLGYVFGEVPVRLPFFWAWMSSGTPDSAFALPLSGAEWTAEGAVKPAFTDGAACLTVEGGNYGDIATQVTVDLDKTPLLALNVEAGGGSWAVKVNAGGDAADVLVISDTSTGGRFVADIREATGWAGTRTFSLKLFAVGEGETVTCRDLDLRSVDGLAARRIVWAPHEIVTEAGDGAGTRIETTTCFPDESSVAQLMRVERLRTGKLQVVGYSSRVKVAWDEAYNSLILKANGFRAAIAFSRPARWVGASENVWTVEFTDLKPADETVVVARLAPDTEDVDATVVGAVNFANPTSFRDALDARESAWNTLLSKVPHPLDFTLRLIDRPKATPEALRRMYYKAWAFTMGNSLPPMPENDFPFPQVSCGKPSLWAEGHPKAAPSAQWESFVAMQLTAWVDPGLAWDSFEGMMSLVDDEGTLGGEGLPSRHVQTAWVLYSLTRDAKRLARIYPAMKRMLVWKASDPRWIYKGLTPPGFKDAEFVVHALMDMSWAVRISEVLGAPEEARFWKQQIGILKENYRLWFWETPGGTPYFTYHEEQGRRSGDRASWTLQGLALPESVLSEPQKQSMLELFRSMMDESVPFLVRGLNKFPQCNYAMVGLWQYGSPEEVAGMAEGAMSAVAMAGEFAECYADTFPVFTWGVTPSMFGAASMIDGTLWHNGILLGDGLPIILHTPDAKGVDDLTWRDGPISVRFSGDEVELWGEGLRHLRAPDGFTMTEREGRPVWHGTLPVGKQVTLR